MKKDRRCSRMLEDEQEWVGAKRTKSSNPAKGAGVEAGRQQVAPWARLVFRLTANLKDGGPRVTRGAWLCKLISRKVEKLL